MSEYDDSTASTKPPTPPIRYDSTRDFNYSTSIIDKPLPKTPDEDEAFKKTKTKQTKG
jgi:hypothetical protein